MWVVLEKGSIHNEPWTLDGYHFTFWIDLFFTCYDFSNDGLTFTQWPDGGTYLEQDNFTISAFRALREGVHGFTKAERRRAEMKSKGRK